MNAFPDGDGGGRWRWGRSDGVPVPVLRRRGAGQAHQGLAEGVVFGGGQWCSLVSDGVDGSPDLEVERSGNLYLIDEKPLDQMYHHHPSLVKTGVSSALSKQ